MTDIRNSFGTLYYPTKAFVVFRHKASNDQIYVESYDVDGNGYPINAHPLSISESNALARALDSSSELKPNFLKPEGLIPRNVLYINPEYNGYAVWYTPRQTVNVLFLEKLGIPNGKANMPPLLWKASKNTLSIYALPDVTSLSEATLLYHAPFFNVYENGKVCMGTVSVNIPKDCQLETFMQLWQEYFFNSYFSHLFSRHEPVKGNIVQLWQSLVNKDKQFPNEALIENGWTIKNIIL